MHSHSRRSLRRGAALVVGCCALSAIFMLDLDGPSFFDDRQPQLPFSDGRRHLKGDAQEGRIERPAAAHATSEPAPRKPEEANEEHKPRQNRALLASSSGVGPVLSARDGRRYTLGDVPRKGVTWYNLLASPKVEWNAAPYTWPACPQDANAWLGHTTFSFREPHPDYPELISSKHLRFRVERRDERECTWNFSKACLAGGSFVMNLGKTAKDMLYPGLYTLKTAEGTIRIVAYNSIRACTIQEPNLASREDIQIKTPMDYLRRSVPSTADPAACQAWIDAHPTTDDLFAVASDHATVHVDAPWMQILIQVKQTKVATEERCVHGGMDVWITDASEGVLEDDFDGVLGTVPAGAATSRALRQGTEALEGEAAAVRVVEGKAHVIDGPFGESTV